MLLIRIGQRVYVVNEGNGTLTVCVERIGQTTDPITVTFTTSDGSALGE